MTQDTSSSAPESRWRRDPAAKRVAILRAARQLFTERGYGPTTVRQIAALAGVNQSLVFHYFGSKQELYDRAVGYHDFVASLFEDGAEEGVRKLVLSFLPSGTNRTPGPAAALIRGARDQDVPARLRARAFDEVVSHLCADADGEEALLFSELLVAWVVGIGVMHDIVGRPRLREARPERIASILSEAIRSVGRPDR